MKQTCTLCPHRCALSEGQTGFCRARTCEGGEIRPNGYGRVTALSLDPIEKKPLARFMPGSRILSVGGYGCNLRCPFCQNSDISMAGGDIHTIEIAPEALVGRAAALVPQGNIGLAFTYNEPLIHYEYVRDCAALANARGLKVALVTNGMFSQAPLEALLDNIDAMNIDLKGFTQRFYDMLGGDLQTVMDAICLCQAHCHVEITTLVIPGENDSEADMASQAGWLASVNPDIPLHISRFFPSHRMRNKPPTPIATIYRLRDIAAKRLRYVYTGNC